MVHFLIQKAMYLMSYVYIQNQEIHPRKETFLDEYKKALKLFGVEYAEQYIFEELVLYKTFLRNECQIINITTHKMFLWNKYNSQWSEKY